MGEMSSFIHGQREIEHRKAQKFTASASRTHMETDPVNN
jgi:hypothetical protein